MCQSKYTYLLVYYPLLWVLTVCQAEGNLKENRALPADGLKHHTIWVDSEKGFVDF